MINSPKNLVQYYFCAKIHLIRLWSEGVVPRGPRRLREENSDSVILVAPLATIKTRVGVQFSHFECRCYSYGTCKIPSLSSPQTSDSLEPLSKTQVNTYNALQVKRGLEQGTKTRGELGVAELFLTVRICLSAFLVCFDGKL
jgi:hypothetical protein